MQKVPRGANLNLNLLINHCSSKVNVLVVTVKLWTSGCSASSNDTLVEKLAVTGLISRENVKAAMLMTDRAIYVPEIEMKEENSLKYQVILLEICLFC